VELLEAELSQLIVGEQREPSSGNEGQMGCERAKVVEVLEAW
jgi:hypothetical protein